MGARRRHVVSFAAAAAAVVPSKKKQSSSTVHSSSSLNSSSSSPFCPSAYGSAFQVGGIPKSKSCPALAEEDYEVDVDALILGEGCFGTVTLAKDRTTGREVAVKRIRSCSTRAQLFAEREYALARRVSAVDASEPVSSLVKPVAGYSGRAAAARSYDVDIVYDLMRGGSLEQLDLKNHPLAEEDVRRVMARVLAGIATMHKAQVAHCDIKLGNVLLEEPGNWGSARICDFGLAQDVSDGKKITTVAGTPQCFAPEIVEAYCTQGASSFGREVDLWAAGVLMYELLCGAKPFSSTDPKALFLDICHVDVRFAEPAWDRISPEAKQLVSKLLTFYPDKRVTAKRALKHAWFRATRKSYNNDGEKKGLFGSHYYCWACTSRPAVTC